MSLCEVTPEKAAKRQRAQASSAASGIRVRSGTEDSVLAGSVGARGSILEIENGVLQEKVASGAARSGPGRDEA